MLEVFFKHDLNTDFRFVADACSELNLRQANYLPSIFYLKFQFYTQ